MHANCIKQVRAAAGGRQISDAKIKAIDDAISGKMRDLARQPELFSLNTATVRERWNLQQIIDGCLRHGVKAIAPWRE